MIFELDQMATELASYSESLEGLKNSLNIDEAIEKVTELEEIAGDPDFWNDMEKAQKNLQQTKQLKNKIEGYEEIITIRNKFGHCKQEKRKDGTEYLKIKDEKKEYDEEACTNLRRNIRDYNLAFEKLHNYVISIKDSLMELEDVKSS